MLSHPVIAGRDEVASPESINTDRGIWIPGPPLCGVPE
jgi:hypothetical protein